MTTFEKREQALENKYFHDEKTKFRIVSRRRKLLGLWAGRKMHKSDEETLQYALEIVRFGVDDNSEGAVVRKILKDINAAGVVSQEKDIRDKMEELNNLAKSQVEEELGIN